MLIVRSWIKGLIINFKSVMKNESWDVKLFFGRLLGICAFLFEDGYFLFYVN